MNGNQTYKVDESKMLEAQCLIIELGNIESQLDDWIRRASKILPRRCQRFERASFSVSLKLFRLSQLYQGITISGVLPDQQNHTGSPEW